MYYYYQLLFLFLVSGYAIDDVARFLHDQGLDHLSPNFLADIEPGEIVSETKYVEEELQQESSPSLRTN